MAMACASNIPIIIGSLRFPSVSPKTKADTKVKAKKEVPKKGDDFKNYSVEKLKELLKDAINKEDYERAAKLRDELSKRN